MMRKCKNRNKRVYPKKTVYFKSYTEDFDGGDMRERKIDGSYPYVRKNVFFRFVSFILYRLLATPAAYIYTKFFMHERYYGRDKLKNASGGYFLYGNHTQPIADAFTPNMLSFPKKNFVVISSKNFSLPVLGPVLPHLGGVPLPTDLYAVGNFGNCIKTRLAEGCAVTVYPEAHLWPYCSFIRPYGADSFEYPVRFNKPVFAFTRVYKKRGSRGFKCDVFIDGPFYPDTALSKREAREKLLSEVRAAMTERSGQSDITVIEYKSGVAGTEGQH